MVGIEFGISMMGTVNTGIDKSSPKSSSASRVVLITHGGKSRNIPWISCGNLENLPAQQAFLRHSFSCAQT